MHRLVTRRVLGQTLCSSCRKAAIRRANVAPLYRILTGPFSASQRQRTYHTPSQVTPTYDFHHDTIYALSSAEGKAGIAVIRISGPSCIQIYHKLCPNKKAPQPRYATVRTLFVPGTAGSEILDSAALVLYFPGPQTVTGEDVLELHVHGGSATVKAVLSAIPKCNDSSSDGDGGSIRYAEPGEFTRRAFANDRLDLAQVEALSETLAAETEQQRRAAVRGSSGALGRTYEGWRRRLLAARAEMEALIDFQEDQHFDESPASLVSGVSQQVREILEGIRVHEMASQRTELLRNGIQVALLGPPNAGKSSLMNQIVGREASIVSGESGTTRDIVEANLDIRGYLCTFADTAGFRTAATTNTNANTTRNGGGGAVVDKEDATQPEIRRIGAVEEEGIRRARTRAAQSDVIIVLASVEERPAATTTTTTTTAVGAGGSHEIRYDMETLRLAAACPQRLVLVNKIDAIPAAADLAPLVRRFRDEVLRQIPGLEDVVPTLISCEAARQHQQQRQPSQKQKTNKQSSDQQDPGGVRLVADSLVLAFQNMTSLPATLQDLHGVTERQRQLLVQCRESLEEYVVVTEGVDEEDHHAAARDIDITMAAEHLRYAASCLGRITRRGEAGDVEEILGVIFEKFCVGK
ncbi:GTP-binding protein TrmE N-terminus-domain-containing protein [Xylaria sp. FL1042]|nr:GTP-binding protein TrmE N-terminus-domain-containing protein [Xylaria sp. FL1042]